MPDINKNLPILTAKILHRRYYRFSLYKSSAPEFPSKYLILQTAQLRRFNKKHMLFMQRNQKFLSACASGECPHSPAACAAAGAG
jgi:hypothetical protein